MFSGDLFQSSMMARPASHRVAIAAAMVGCLWLAIWWAVSLP